LPLELYCLQTLALQTTMNSDRKMRVNDNISLEMKDDSASKFLDNTRVPSLNFIPELTARLSQTLEPVLPRETSRLLIETRYLSPFLICDFKEHKRTSIFSVAPSRNPSAHIFLITITFSHHVIRRHQPSTCKKW